MIPITTQDILKLIKGLIKFPFPTICRHSVVCDLLSLLESHGWDCPDELARAVVKCDDEVAIKVLSEVMDK